MDRPPLRVDRTAAAEFIPGQSEHTFGRGVPLDDLAGGVLVHEPLGHGAEQESLAPLARIEFDHRGPVLGQRELLLHDLCEIVERADLTLVEGSGLGVDHAESPDPLAAAPPEHPTGVEPDVRGSGDEWVLDEAVVTGCVLDDEQVRPGVDRMCAERVAACSGPDVESDARREPLLLVIDQRDECDRNVEQLGGNAGDPIETLLVLCADQTQSLHSGHPARLRIRLLGAHEGPSAGSDRC